jgi:aspartate/methionine/tyrosine aminotransferase
VVLAVEPDRRRRLPAEVEAVGRWAVEHGIWVVADEIYEHLVYGDAEHVSMPVAVPELADTCVVVNGVAKTYAMTGWRVGWLIGPADVVKAPPTCSRTPPATSATSRRSPRWQAVPGDLSAVAEMREAFDRGAGRWSAARRDPGRDLPRARGRLLLLPVGQGRARARRCAGGRPRPPPSSPSWCSTRSAVAVVPGEAFGTPGYFRLSYALGDDDLVKGVTRLADLLAEAR